MPHQLLVRRVKTIHDWLRTIRFILGEESPTSLGTKPHRGGTREKSSKWGQMAVGIATNGIYQSDKAVNTSLSLTSPKITLASTV